MTPILTTDQQAQALQDEVDALRRIAAKQKEFFRKYPYRVPMDFWDWGYGVLPTQNLGTFHFEIPDSSTDSCISYTGRSITHGEITDDMRKAVEVFRSVPPQKKLIVIDTSKEKKPEIDIQDVINYGRYGLLKQEPQNDEDITWHERQTIYPPVPADKRTKP